ncbi:uncharacterized protein MONBRDRAFT_9164 [Monosiga brevicollis MX1]|uniref:Uncharacterized protein n=1 Tax=Monosiga brevicollis TaxID=81824 RepID=A9V2A3_MONBE|nr:uncharacterized protein MONBRDRAFT_9164 [Monosiga brevicollis MX1]EDQ88340.1 predicted protein [Monosiga brevicollis MX1]|eukprot:XP_001746933.1 hypothetical protein [Monosiga brevicollis MX1]
MADWDNIPAAGRGKPGAYGRGAPPRAALGRGGKPGMGGGKPGMGGGKPSRPGGKPMPGGKPSFAPAPNSGSAVGGGKPSYGGGKPAPPLRATSGGKPAYPSSGGKPGYGGGKPTPSARPVGGGKPAPAGKPMPGGKPMSRGKPMSGVPSNGGPARPTGGGKPTAGRGKPGVGMAGGGKPVGGSTIPSAVRTGKPQYARMQAGVPPAARSGKPGPAATPHVGPGKRMPFANPPPQPRVQASVNNDEDEDDSVDAGALKRDLSVHAYKRPKLNQPSSSSGSLGAAPAPSSTAADAYARHPVERQHATYVPPPTAPEPVASTAAATTSTTPPTAAAAQTAARPAATATSKSEGPPETSDIELIVGVSYRGPIQDRPLPLPQRTSETAKLSNKTAALMIQKYYCPPEANISAAIKPRLDKLFRFLSALERRAASAGSEASNDMRLRLFDTFIFHSVSPKQLIDYAVAMGYAPHEKREEFTHTLTNFIPQLSPKATSKPKAADSSAARTSPQRPAPATGSGAKRPSKDQRPPAKKAKSAASDGATTPAASALTNAPVATPPVHKAETKKAPIPEPTRTYAPNKAEALSRKSQADAYTGAKQLNTTGQQSPAAASTHALARLCEMKTSAASASAVIADEVYIMISAATEAQPTSAPSKLNNVFANLNQANKRRDRNKKKTSATSAAVPKVCAVYGFHPRFPRFPRFPRLLP